MKGILGNGASGLRACLKSGRSFLPVTLFVSVTPLSPGSPLATPAAPLQFCFVPYSPSVLAFSQMSHSDLFLFRSISSSLIDSLSADEAPGLEKAQPASDSAVGLVDMQILVPAVSIGIFRVGSQDLH